MGSMVSLTRPPVAFSTSLAQPCSTTAVRWCWGETHDDIVSVVVCAIAGDTTAPIRASAVSATLVSMAIGSSSLGDSRICLRAVV